MLFIYLFQQTTIQAFPRYQQRITYLHHEMTYFTQFSLENCRFGQKDWCPMFRCWGEKIPMYNSDSNV